MVRSAVTFLCAALALFIPAMDYVSSAGETDEQREAAKKQFISDLKKEHVITLTSTNFSSVVHEGNKAVLVDFYAPWCGHCKRLAPEYSRLGLAVARDPQLKHRLIIAQVDAAAEQQLASFYEVTGYPTIQLFPPPAFKGAKSAPRRYVGEHQARSMMEWLRGQFDTSRTGRVYALDLLAREFMLAANSSDRQAEVLSRLRESAAAAEAAASEAEESGGRKNFLSSATLYLKFMEKAFAHGIEFIEKERARLLRLMQGTVTAEKYNDLVLRHNVLQGFLETPDPSG